MTRPDLGVYQVECQQAGLVPLAALGGPPRTNGPIADDAIKPGHRMFRGLGLRGQLEERFLDDIFGYGTPLPRVQHQRRRVCVNQTAQQFRSHRYHDAGRVRVIPREISRQPSQDQ